MKITDIALKNCLYELDSFCNFQPTPDQLRELVEKNSYFVEEMNKWYATELHGLDTQDRGMLLDIISRHFMGFGWPTYGDDVDVEAFSVKLTEAVKAANWGVR